jgi:hypothetical protein
MLTFDPSQDFILSLRDHPLGLAAIGDLSSGRIWAIVLGVLFAIVAIALLVASWTRWGQTKSLTKCIALAFLAHVWLLMYAYGTRIIVPGSGGGTGGGARSANMSMTVNLLDSTEPDPTLIEGPNSPTVEPDLQREQDSEPQSESTETTVSSESQPKPSRWEAPLAKSDLSGNAPESVPAPTVPSMAAPAPANAAEMPVAFEPELPTSESAEEIMRMAGLSTPALYGRETAPSASALAVPSSRLAILQSVTMQSKRVDQRPIPSSYAMRLSPERQNFAMLSGGDANTEASVEKALAWLAQAQAFDGSWNAAAHGAGREVAQGRNRMDGEYRHNAGLKANTAMTGLALLAFLGAGHTQLEGRHHDQVALGLRYLLSQQLPSGDLSGRDQVGQEPTVLFARMYSHGMAALALTEAYNMTGDQALLPAIQSACRYTQRAMNPRTGGWRYSVPTEDPGDTSQFGWQAMTLHSAASNGAISLEPQTRQRMQSFLDSVRTGQSGGLAVYRVRQSGLPTVDEATPAMTAEAMASRLLLGMPVTPAAADEAQRMLLSRLPGRSEENLYYWYYATLALYQLQGDRDDSKNSWTWNQWNDALKQELCVSQIPQGSNAGSWNPTCIWGGYGGRVYSTAIACMCLEVYYRYLPMYQAEQFANQWKPAVR